MTKYAITFEGNTFTPSFEDKWRNEVMSKWWKDRRNRAGIWYFVGLLIGFPAFCMVMSAIAHYGGPVYVAFALFIAGAIAVASAA